MSAITKWVPGTQHSTNRDRAALEEIIVGNV